MLQRPTVCYPHNPLAHAHSWLTPHEAVSRAFRTAQSLYHMAGSPATQDNRESSLHQRGPALHQQPPGRFVSIDSLYCRADSTTSPCARSMLATPSTSHRDAVVPTRHARTLVVDVAIAASSMRHATHASLHRHQHRPARPSHLRHGRYTAMSPRRHGPCHHSTSQRRQRLARHKLHELALCAEHQHTASRHQATRHHEIRLI
jgi:hypothetical protein